MDITGFGILPNIMAFKTGYDASQAEQEALAARARKITYISIGASVVGAVLGVMYAGSSGKSKLAWGLLGFMILGTITTVAGSLIIAKQETQARI